MEVVAAVAVEEEVADAAEVVAVEVVAVEEVDAE